MTSSRNDAWEEIFRKLNVLELVNSVGYCDVTADQIKAASGGYEPRLLAKIDFREHLPSIMRRHELSILAIGNGVYRIGRFDPFVDICPEPAGEVKPVPFPEDILTLDIKRLNSESAVLDAALHAGVLRMLFGEDVKLTIRGRERCGSLLLPIHGEVWRISGVQIEVDGGYEGNRSVNLVEAKIGVRNNISIRQLLYPQLYWEGRIKKRKEVRTYICFYQEPIIRFIPFALELGSKGFKYLILHEKEQSFLIEPRPRFDLFAIPPKESAWNSKIRIPFPQADRFDTILAMLRLIVRDKEKTKEELLMEFDITPRQIDYYVNALVWIGLVSTNDHCTVVPTAFGTKVSESPWSEKMRMLAEVVFSHPIFNYALRHGTESVPSDLFSKWNVHSLSTQERRFQTVKAWLRFFEKELGLK